MPRSFNGCPPDPDASATAYLAGRLPAEEAAHFEEHFLACPGCSARFQFTEEFIAAYRRAAERLGRATLRVASAGA
jgi:anti-sigma factor RsiW